MFSTYKAGRQAEELFGDFLVRAGQVARTINGSDFHDHTGALKPAA